MGIYYMNEEQAEDLGMIVKNAETYIARKINDWVEHNVTAEPYSENYTNIYDIHVYVFTSRLLETFNDIFTTYPPANCRRSRISYFSRRLHDITFI